MRRSCNFLYITKKQESRISELEKVITKYRKCLEFYAEHSHYVYPRDKDTQLSSIDLDNGKRAQAALRAEGQ